jgi:hypothetical protein
MRRQVSLMVFVGWAMIAASVGASPAAGDEAAVTAPPTVAVQRVPVALPAVRDEAAMLLVGTALIGLAAAVRRAA